MNYEHIRSVDPEIYDIMDLELSRQRNQIELIASENFTSVAVMQAIGSHLTNKYAEGYPGKRYYGGCEFVDMVESLAIERVKKLYGAEHANVQPHSGSQANVAVYLALLKPEDAVLGMDLSCGGHLTHGSRASITGKYFNIFQYGVDPETECIDYDELMKIAKECRPKMIICGASAYSRYIDWAKFREVCDEVGAYMMADIAHIGGLVAAGVHPSPLPYADVVTSTTHKSLRGPRGAFILCREELRSKIDSAIFPGTQGGPLMNVIAAKAVCFKEAFDESFVTYQQRIKDNAAALADSLQNAGVRLVSGGTDNHMMLADVSKCGANGAQMQDLLEKAGITANKNTIPYDKMPPSLASGVRFGSPAVTTRGFNEAEMREVGDIIADLVFNKENALPEATRRVQALISKFPLYECIK
ncbi:MAG: serine hydroxymethyltransferase [Ruminococcaceae bacterium]|nr:serine hydroxymethyltransferase [Oscillospiraceae bacterium]